jgi:flagellin
VGSNRHPTRRDVVAFVSGTGNEFSAGDVDLTGYTQSLNLNIKIKMVSAGDGSGTKAVATVTINGVTRSVTADDDSATAPSFTLTSATFGDIFESGQQVVITGANTPDTGDEVNITISGQQNGITALSVSDNTLAGMAITAIDSAIVAVSSQRSKLGAYQNRLEHTINNLNTASENLTSAESRIRDVDMASEMVEYSKMNILTQAAQAMLAQANQQPQNILRLLQ